MKFPKHVDPRTTSIVDYVRPAILAADEHERQDEILAVLDGPRDTVALSKLARIMSRRPGLRYDAQTIVRRSTNRLDKAFEYFDQFGSGSPSVMLDVGCARAENAHLLSEYSVKKYIGIDVDNLHFPEIATLEVEAELVKASAEAMPFADNSVDLAVSFNVFEHIPTPVNALSEVVRVLRPGGVFYTKFGPPFNAANGPHLTRKIDMPFLHHIFPRDEVAKFSGRNPAYSNVNQRSTKYYRDTFFKEDGFKLAFYSEQIDNRGFWLLKALPSIVDEVPLDELVVCAITAVVVKNPDSEN